MRISHIGKQSAGKSSQLSCEHIPMYPDPALSMTVSPSPLPESFTTPDSVSTDKKIASTSITILNRVVIRSVFYLNSLVVTLLINARSRNKMKTAARMPVPKKELPLLDFLFRWTAK